MNPSLTVGINPSEGENEGLDVSVTPQEYEQSSVHRRLYISHFLSTWNSRVFEFGAVLYLASIFPGTLLPMSVYALARSISAILFSPFIGRYIDKSQRLWIVRLSIGNMHCLIKYS
jgi:solute carrier family 40 (iron-regulated transporter), member 1